MKATDTVELQPAPPKKKAPRKRKFSNEPIADFTEEKPRAGIEAALGKLSRARPRKHLLRIGDQSIDTGEWIESRDPAQPETLIGRVARAGVEHVDRAVEVATTAFETWKRVPFDERAEVILKAARVFRRRRYELDALMVREAGKSWMEADADTAEAIDFLEFYGREMLRYGADPQLPEVPGEDNRLDYLPLGVIAVIPPWNFPVAILTGMTAAAIVAGNTVLLKPSSETPVLAAKVVELLEKAGVPPGVLCFIPGGGSDIGDHLVSHPGVRAISFTGSMEVGLRINELAARTPDNQLWIKRVIAEMGGKDAILVDETADLDAAAEGIVASAFGYQGQKCSACSRLIAVDEIHDELIERVVERARHLTIGPVEDPATQVGPVISAAAMEKILGYIEVGRGEGTLVLGGGRARVPGREKGYFIEPTIFTGVAPDARIAQEEIFGPVLACIRAQDIDDGLRIANGTRYGLTGAIYSRSRERLERARSDFHVGNLYLNRKCTGALVGGQPFGGFNRSGTDSKAGGSDYLLLFLQAKSVSEKL